MLINIAAFHLPIDDGIPVEMMGEGNLYLLPVSCSAFGTAFSTLSGSFSWSFWGTIEASPPSLA